MSLAVTLALLGVSACSDKNVDAVPVPVPVPEAAVAVPSHDAAQTHDVEWRQHGNDVGEQRF